MKFLLTTVMAFGVVFMLGGNQPTKAADTQAVSPIYKEYNIRSVDYYYDDYGTPYYVVPDRYYYYYPQHGFRFHFGF